MATTSLLLSSQRRHHTGLPTFRTCNTVLPAEAVSREKIFGKTLLKMLPAIRALKMMVGRFGGDPDHVYDNDERHHNNNIYECWHGVFLL